MPRGGTAEVRDVRQLAARIDREGYIAVSTLPRSERAALVTALEQRGYERTQRFVRRPLRDQLLERVRRGDILAAKVSLPGGSARESRAALDLLVAESLVAPVVRDGKTYYVNQKAPRLSERRRDELEASLSGLVKALRRAQRIGATLLDEDVRRALDGALSRRKEPSNGLAKTEANVREETSSLRALVQRHVRPSGLAYLPDFVPGTAAERTQMHDALVAAVRAGWLELRPESGLARLSKDHLQRSVRGPYDTRLSWARIVENDEA